MEGEIRKLNYGAEKSIMVAEVDGIGYRVGKMYR